MPHDSDELSTGPILELLRDLASEWFMLGTYLEVPHLDDIDDRIKCNACMCKTLKKWISHKEEEATLPVLIAAVRGSIIENEALAQRIEASPVIKKLFEGMGMYM